MRAAGRVTFFWLWGNREVLQESCAQLEVTVLRLGGSLSSSRRTQIYYVLIHSFSRNQDPALIAALLFSWLLFLCFCIPLLPWLATVWICPLGLREGLGGWSLFPINKKWGTQKGLGPRRAPHGPARFHWLNKELLTRNRKSFTLGSHYNHASTHGHKRLSAHMTLKSENIKHKRQGLHISNTAKLLSRTWVTLTTVLLLISVTNLRTLEHLFQPLTRM